MFFKNLQHYNDEENIRVKLLIFESEQSFHSNTYLKKFYSLSSWFLGKILLLNYNFIVISLTHYDEVDDKFI